MTAAELGDALSRLCPAHDLHLAGALALPCPLPRADLYRGWLADGRDGGLDYMARDPEERLDPGRRNPWARSLLVFAQSYTRGWPADDPDPSAGGSAGTADRPGWQRRVARYARGLDYHDLLLKDIRAVATGLTELWSDLRCRIATDTGPYLEREYAWLAGLGFIGRNTCLVHERLGSGLFLGVALTDLEISGLPPSGAPAAEPLYGVLSRRPRSVERTDASGPLTRCGNCTRCLEACPTAALSRETEGLDAGLCLSTWSIERRGKAPRGRDADQGGLLFGCDICQAVCPWNRKAARRPHLSAPRPGYEPLPGYADLELRDLAEMETGEFRDRFRRTPLWRCHPEGLRRNARRVLANLAPESPARPDREDRIDGPGGEEEE